MRLIEASIRSLYSNPLMSSFISWTALNNLILFRMSHCFCTATLSISTNNCFDEIWVIRSATSLDTSAFQMSLSTHRYSWSRIWSPSYVPSFGAYSNHAHLNVSNSCMLAAFHHQKRPIHLVEPSPRLGCHGEPLHLLLGLHAHVNGVHKVLGLSGAPWRPFTHRRSHFLSCLSKLKM